MDPRREEHATTRDSRAPWALALLVVSGLAWFRIFSTWFAQDDFRWLLRAASGPHPPLATPRVLSMSLYFRAVHALAGLDPVVFHAIQLGLHLATGILLFLVVARRARPGTAAAAAALYLTSPALFDALHWISGIADLMCSAFLALAVWLVLGTRRAGRAWLAVLAYALALASKEIAVGAAPVLAVLHARAGRGGVARAIVTLGAAVLCAAGAAGAWQTGAGEPYAWRPAAALLNLPAFASGAALGGTAWAHPSDLVWARQLWVRAAGWGILAVWLFALIRARSRPAWMGCAWFVGVLAPVVMLERQFYLYYLACALPGFVASMAFLVAGREATPRWASWTMVALVALQGLAIEARATSRLAAAPLPTDFVLRRALIARNAIGDLTRGRDQVGARVVMLGQQPVEAASQGQSTTPATDYQRDPWWDENVLGALAAGDALKLMLPQVREVTFVPWLAPGDSTSTIAAYGIDGHLTVSEYRTFVSATGGAAPASLAGHLQRAGRFLQRRLFVEARAELLAARALAPDHPDVLLNLGAVEAQLGDSTASLAALTRAVQVAPADVDARFNLGLLLWRMGRREEARGAWDPLLREAPTSDLADRVRKVLAGRAH